MGIKPQKSNKVVEMSQAPDLERLEEIEEVIASQEESCGSSLHSSVDVVADEKENHVVPLTDRTEDKTEIELRRTNFNVSISQTVNEFDEFPLKEKVLPPPPAPFEVQLKKEVPPPVEENKNDDDQIETTSKMNQRLKRVLISKELQK